MGRYHVVNALMNPPTLNGQLAPNHWQVNKTPTSLQRSNFRSDERTRGVKHHRKSKFMSIKHVTNGTTRDTEKRSTRQAIEKTAYEHCLYIFGDGTWNEPDEEEGKRNHIDVPSTVELCKLAYCGGDPRSSRLPTSDNGLRKSGPIPGRQIISYMAI